MNLVIKVGKKKVGKLIQSHGDLHKFANVHKKDVATSSIDEKIVENYFSNACIVYTILLRIHLIMATT